MLAMSFILFVLLLFMLAGTGLLYAASELMGHGYLWPDQICNTVPDLCEHPYWSVLATVAIGCVYVVVQSIET